MKVHLKGNWETREVWLNGEKLTPERSQKIWNHSPDGFNWGYGGSGPSQLALAVLLELCNMNAAISSHHKFKDEVIALLPQMDFEKDVYFQEDDIPF